MPFVTRAVSLVSFASITACYLASYPWQGALYDINGISNYRIPLPASGACNVQSNGNMSLQLAYVSGASAFAMTLFMLVYSIAPRGNNITWPASTLWLVSILIFVLQLVLFVCISARVSVWFLSCQNPSKTTGSCPTTNFNLLVTTIKDKEMCYFSGTDLTLFNQNNDLFFQCHDASAIADYNTKFARWDVPGYYTAASLCTRNETSSLGQDLSWCFYWGCSRVCNPEAYRMNWRFFALDIIQLLLVLFAYTFVIADFYFIKDVKSE